MGKFVAPALGAVGGGLGTSILGSVAGALVSGLVSNIFSPDEPDVPAPPPVVTGPTEDPVDTADREAARIRSIKRRRESDTSRGLLGLLEDEQTEISKKTLLGQ